MSWTRRIINLGLMTAFGFCVNGVNSQIIIDGELSDWDEVAQFDVAPNPEEYAGDFLYPSGDIRDIYVTNNEDSLFIRIDINPDGDINDLEADNSLIQIGFDTDNNVGTGLTWDWWVTGVDYFANITWPNDGYHSGATQDSLGIIRFIGSSNTDSVWEDTYYGCQTAASPDGTSYEIAIPLVALGELSEHLTIMFLTEETVGWTADAYPNSLGNEIAMYHFPEPANPNSVTVSEVFGYPDQNIALPLLVELPPDSSYSSLEISISGFQGDLEFLDIILSGGLMGLAGWSYQMNETDSMLYLAFAGANEIQGQGQLFQLAFHIPEDAEPGFVPVTIQSILYDNTATADSMINGGVAIIPPGYIVSNTADSGPGSLRQYILEANLNPGLDTIKFDIPGPGPHTIQLFSALPTITDPIFIDGTTEPDFSGSPVVELDGSSAGPVTSGLKITAGNSTVRGLLINRFHENGILLEYGGGNVIQGNLIGTDVNGTSPLGNSWDGVRIRQGSNLNIIGGTTESDRNLLSGNGECGVNISGWGTDNNTVLGNYIGTDVSGSAGLGNGWLGISVESHYNVIGQTDAGNLVSGNAGGGIGLSGNVNLIQGNFIGTDESGSLSIGNGDGAGIGIGGSQNVVGGSDPGERNIISGHLGPGIEFCCETVANNQVLGNYIGTDVTGTIALGNGTGINILSAANIIGGDDPGVKNIISGNEGNGIDIGAPGWPTATFENAVKGNFIGTDVTGTVALPNGGAGIQISDSESNLIGGVEPGAGNLISGNQGTGIAVYGSLASGNMVQGNIVGLNASGTSSLGTQWDGIDIRDASDNLIGGIDPGSGNVISGHLDMGISINRDEVDPLNNIIQGNLIGTDITGTLVRGNGASGVMLNSCKNTLLGGPEAGARNVIAGNSQSGIILSGILTTDNIVSGNLIGTTINGTEALGNTRYGVQIRSNASNNLIGGTTEGSANVISANGYGGVIIGWDGVSSGNVVQGNIIGSDISRTLNLGNSRSGITLFGGATDNLIGGNDEGEGNLIVNSDFAGILVDNTALEVNNRISRNSIHSNGGLGIDLSTNFSFPFTDGVTSNDEADGDTGPNNLQNFPERLNVGVDDGGDLMIQYLVDSDVENSDYPILVEFFLSDEDGEGQSFLYDNFYTPANHELGLKTIYLGPAINYGLEMGDYIVATATDDQGNTSEFSQTTQLTTYVGIAEVEALPTEFTLEQNLPNPFNPVTTIRYGLPEAADVSLVIYDLRGRVVRSNSETARPAGWVNFEWNGTNLNGEPVSTGVYLCRLEAGNYTKTMKMLMIK